MAWATLYAQDSLSVSTTELSMVSGNSTLQNVTTDAIIRVIVDPVGSAQALNDIFRLSVYEKVSSAGTKRVVWQKDFGPGVETQSWQTPDLMVMYGWDVTLIKLTGTDRNWNVAIEGVAATITEKAAGATQSVSSVEESLLSGTTSVGDDTDDGVVQVLLDATAMTDDDAFELRIYREVIDTDTTRLLASIPILGEEDRHWASPIFAVMHGWDVRLIRTLGADVTFGTSVRHIG